MMLNSILAFSAKSYDQDFLARAAEGKIGFDCYHFPLDVVSAPMAADYKVVSAFVNDDLSAHTLEVLSRGHTELIALRCAGYNNVDLVAANNLGIKVVNVPSYSPYSVAEYTLTLMLALSRKLPKACNRVKDGNFSLNGLLGFDFYQKTVGIIGCGKIGQLVGDRLKAFGCNILVYDPDKAQLCEEQGFQSVGLNTLFSQSDIITLHCPLLENTRHIINVEAISMMKQGVMLINTSRGGLLDTKAVLASIKSHKIAYLGIDVYEEEGSLFFEDHSSEIIQDDVIQRLTTFPNVIVTGHQGYFTQEALQHISAITVANIMQFIRDEALSNQVTR